MERIFFLGSSNRWKPISKQVSYAIALRYNGPHFFGPKGLYVVNNLTSGTRWLGNGRMAAKCSCIRQLIARSEGQMIDEFFLRQFLICSARQWMRGVVAMTDMTRNKCTKVNDL